MMVRRVGIISFSFCFVTVAWAYGDYDITPEEIGPMCKMVDEFLTTKQPPKPQPLDPPVSGPDCHYFKWVSCDKPSENPMMPCGWYEMRKCESKRKRGAVDDLDEMEDEDRNKRGVPHTSHYDGPILLGFPNERPPIGLDSYLH